MDIIIIDQEDIYAISIKDDASYIDIIQSYIKVSGRPFTNQVREKYKYSIAEHSKKLYVIDRTLESQSFAHSLSLLMLQSDIANWWANVYPIVEQIASVGGAFSVTYEFIRWVRKLAKGNSSNEYEFVKNIFSKPMWNILELSNELSISEKSAKNLLVGFGYKWDRRKLLYVETEKTKELREIKIKNKLF